MTVNRAKSDGFMLRLPDGMRERIKAAGEANQRSMNAEIVSTLEEKCPAPKPVFTSFPDTDLKICILQWIPSKEDWEFIDYYAWANFKAISSWSEEPFAQLSNVGPGTHYFVVGIADLDDRLVNIIPHKYRILKNGAIDPTIFDGLTSGEANEFSRLSQKEFNTDEEAEEAARLSEKLFQAVLPPAISIQPLKAKLPTPASGSAAKRFFKRFGV